MKMDFESIKKHHLDLMVQYGYKLGHVAKHETKYLLKMYVEDHIHMDIVPSVTFSFERTIIL
jgi:hypothetical protein